MLAPATIGPLTYCQWPATRSLPGTLVPAAPAAPADPGEPEHPTPTPTSASERVMIDTMVFISCLSMKVIRMSVVSPFCVLHFLCQFGEMASPLMERSKTRNERRQGPGDGRFPGCPCSQVRPGRGAPVTKWQPKLRFVG